MEVELSVLVTPATRKAKIVKQPRQEIAVRGQRKVIDTLIVGEAEVVTLHRLPGKNGVVGQALLIDITVSGVELSFVGIWSLTRLMRPSILPGVCMSRRISLWTGH
jgi:hypothetical protein